jgi:hypothetical protein
LPVGFQSTEPRLCLHHAGGGHRSAIEAWRQRFTLRATRRIVPCTFSIAVGAGNRAAQLRRQPGAVDGDDLVETFKQAGGDAGGLALHALGEVPDDVLGFGCVIQFLGLA